VTGCPLASKNSRLLWKPTSTETQWADQTLPRAPFVAVHADAGTPAKRWPAARFADVIRALTHPIVLIGTDARIGREITQHLPGRASLLDLTGQTSLTQLVTLIQRADRVLSCDSGPAHIAAALGKPTWIVWSGTSTPSQWAPRGPQIHWIRHEVPCAPCGFTVCPLPRRLCMEDLTVEHVLEALG